MRTGVEIGRVDVDVFTGTPSVSAQICRVTDFHPLSEIDE